MNILALVILLSSALIMGGIGQKLNRPKEETDSHLSWLAREKKAIDESTPPVVASMVRETPIETAALVKRAFLFLEDGNFGEADRYFEQALNQDPENAKAYIGKLLVELNIKKEDDLVQYSSFLDSFSSYQKALRFASEDYKSVLIGYTILDRLEKI